MLSLIFQQIVWRLAKAFHKVKKINLPGAFSVTSGVPEQERHLRGEAQLCARGSSHPIPWWPCHRCCRIPYTCRAPWKALGKLQVRNCASLQPCVCLSNSTMYLFEQAVTISMLEISALDWIAKFLMWMPCGAWTARNFKRSAFRDVTYDPNTHRLS